MESSRKSLLSIILYSNKSLSGGSSRPEEKGGQIMRRTLPRLVGKLAFFLSSSEITKRVPKLDLIRKYYRAKLIYLDSLR